MPLDDYEAYRQAMNHGKSRLGRPSPLDYAVASRDHREKNVDRMNRMNRDQEGGRPSRRTERKKAGQAALRPRSCEGQGEISLNAALWTGFLRRSYRAMQDKKPVHKCANGIGVDDGIVFASWSINHRERRDR